MPATRQHASLVSCIGTVQPFRRIQLKLIYHPIRSNLLARISQSFSSIFLSQQISISTSTS
jgi:hypothetical protein